MITFNEILAQLIIAPLAFLHNGGMFALCVCGCVALCACECASARAMIEFSLQNFHSSGTLAVKLLLAFPLIGEREREESRRSETFTSITGTTTAVKRVFVRVCVCVTNETMD